MYHLPSFSHLAKWWYNNITVKTDINTTRQNIFTSTTTRFPDITRPHSPISDPWQSLFSILILSLWDYFYKWNHTVCAFWELDFFSIQHKSLIICSFTEVVLFINSPFLFYHWPVFHGRRCTRVCLLSHLLKDIWIVSNFWLLWIKLFFIDLYVNIEFHFSQTSAQRCNR